MWIDIVIIGTLMILLLAFIAITIAFVVMRQNRQRTGLESEHTTVRATYPVATMLDPTSEIYVFADMNQLGLRLQTEDQITIGLETAKQLAAQLYDEPEDSFIGFQYNHDVIQFLYLGEGDDVVFERPDMIRFGADQATITSIRKMHEIITLFYDHGDLDEILDCTFQSYEKRA